MAVKTERERVQVGGTVPWLICALFRLTDFVLQGRISLLDTVFDCFFVLCVVLL